MINKLSSIMKSNEFINSVLSGSVLLLIGILLNRINKVFEDRRNKGITQSQEKYPIYLSKPKRLFSGKCFGRDKHLIEAYNQIHAAIKDGFIPKSIGILGEEGVGKSLICYSLFMGQLKKEKVYLGWIDSCGKNSIFDIIKKTIEDSRFHRKSKQEILTAFEDLDKPCVLFVDEVNHYTPIDELKELATCPNVILILSGIFRVPEIIDYPIEVSPFDDLKMRQDIFNYYSGVDCSLLMPRERDSVEHLLKYTKGNPFLIRAIAEARYHYNGRWSDMLECLDIHRYSETDYLKKVLEKLFKIDKLDRYERDALSKLSTIGYKGFVRAVFEILDIPEVCVESLCKTYWLNQNDQVLYYMTDFRREVIVKVLTDKYNLRNAIEGLFRSLSRWGAHEDKGFRWLSPYVEKILNQVNGYAVDLLDEEFFSEFSLEVAYKYETIYNKEKQLEWIKLCKICSKKSEYRKAFLELRTEAFFVDTEASFSELKQRYLELKKKIEATNDTNQKKYFEEEYIFFLIGCKHYKDAISLCQEYFKSYAFDLSNEYNCDIYFRYLQAANYLEDDETLRKIVNDEIIQELYRNDKISISAAWCFCELGKLYKKWGNPEISNRYIRHMVILLNEERCFFHNDIKDELKISDEEFAEYMHSCEELSESLEAALQREDAEALYIEGRYQEKHGNYKEALIRYKEAACRDSLRGMCSLALLYYRGQGETRDYEKAKKYWEYCCDREHRGSHYWLGILLLDEFYPENDKEKALEHLKTAADMGSERAKKKLENM